MPRLVLINGAPASGKSTLAKRYAHDHALTLVLDIDEVRAMLGSWFDHAQEAGIAARRLAVAMAAAHLGEGRDVLVPQLLAKVPFVLELEGVAREAGASFVEVALVSQSPEAAVSRFARRSDEAAEGVHRDASALVERGGGHQMIHDYYAGVMEVVAQRPATTVIATEDGQVDQAYAALTAAIEQAPA